MDAIETLKKFEQERLERFKKFLADHSVHASEETAKRELALFDSWMEEEGIEP